ncbi:MAG: hypothetical protein LWW88_08900 [Acinetobacter sp.]|uniref:hypothetical protein n=1 Tax=Acinetobacter sp. TaxID=472 RepID=UPI002582DB00|nr:hypothetical protein [Acinetobacter sp.]MCE1271668.1 hypothetical protein [Acinetobacter sp.]
MKEKIDMHDWSLISIHIDWAESSLKVQLRNNQSEDVALIAEKFKSFHIANNTEWGKSISINQILDFSILENGNSRIIIEIQSGDLFEIEAKKITLPFIS